MTTIIQAIGLVLVVEGLAFALAPSRLQDALILLARLPVEVRRTLGLGALALGVLLLWLAKGLAG